MVGRYSMSPAPAFAFDLDGTLADCTHRLHHIIRAPGDDRPKDWRALFAAVGGDTPIMPMVEIAQALLSRAHWVIIITGRPDECRSATREWLTRHFGPRHRLPLYMRRAGDHRNDDIVKPELFREAERDGYRIVQAFEDRSRVVDALRAAGYAVAQVAEGRF